MSPDSDQLSIETPELVDIEMPLAGIGSRFIALLVDYLIWGAGLLALIFIGIIVLPAFGIKDFRTVGDCDCGVSGFPVSVGLLHAV